MTEESDDDTGYYRAEIISSLQSEERERQWHYSQVGPG